MNTVLEKIKKMGIVPVVVIENEKDAVPLADALCNGGLACAEVTFRTAAAGEAIRLMKEAHPEMLVGAASLLGMERFSNTADMQEYLKNSSAPEKIRKNRELLTREDEMAEFMFLGLRMTQGVSKKEFQEYFGTAIENIYGEVLKKYKKQGLLLEESGRIFLSREGIHVSNAVMADFLL